MVKVHILHHIFLTDNLLQARDRCEGGFRTFFRKEHFRANYPPPPTDIPPYPSSIKKGCTEVQPLRDYFGGMGYAGSYHLPAAIVSSVGPSIMMAAPLVTFSL